MMQNSLIRVERLGKRYILRSQQQRQSKTVVDALRNVLSSPFDYFRSTLQAPGEENTFWALRDISFDIKEGELVGFIGRNGAGKSTLLKILSRITHPTEGEAHIYGRVGSLLEVGTGFHPELSGRENIYMNGVILGMKKAEVDAVLDEIIAFAEIDKFIDTPVKFYSSGMYVRLGFAVAAHLNPQILIVDEVLAVGDVRFQRQSLGKMENVSKDGRTVLFVSHNMRAVQQLCTRVIWLENGKIVEDGPAQLIAEKYLQSFPLAENTSNIQNLIQQIPPDPVFHLLDVAILQDSQPINRVVNGKPCAIELHYQVLEEVTGFRIFFDLCDTDGNILFRSFHDDDVDDIPTTKPGEYISRAVIPAHILSPLDYELRIYAGIYNVRMCIPGLGLRVPLSVENTSRMNRAYPTDVIRSKLSPYIPWNTLLVNENVSVEVR